LGGRLRPEQAADFLRFSRPRSPEYAVILYTDGILDYSNARGEFFGKERLLRILGQFAASPVQILMDMVQESMKNFAGGTNPNDDASIMAIEYME
jgi:sigma-B regulation protein RsbU (phosphoserine phosphatase)